MGSVVVFEPSGVSNSGIRPTDSCNRAVWFGSRPWRGRCRQPEQEMQMHSAQPLLRTVSQNQSRVSFNDFRAVGSAANSES